MTVRLLACLILFSLAACDKDADNANAPIPVNQVETVTIGLPDGSTLAVDKGSSGEALATYLASNDPAPRSFEMGEVQFGDWSSDATPVTNAKLVALVQLLKAYPDVKIKLVGHSDGAGDPKDNLRISAERAQAAKTELVTSGISADRIETEGVGMAQPIADNSTVEGRARNRRVSLVVTKK